MQSWMIFIPIILPLLGGALCAFLPFETMKHMHIYTAAVVVFNSMIIAALILTHPQGGCKLLQLTSAASIAFRIDGLSMVFGALICILWPLSTVYAFEYMEHEGNEQHFFAWFTMTYAAAAGVAFSANFITLYLCYELLTLFTLPLIMHKMDMAAISAGRKYLIYSITGASFALMGILILYSITGSFEFVYGGQFAALKKDFTAQLPLIRTGYLFAFFGFGVKSAVWPLHGWLPTAGVAPTPVTALLHAVAVVKAGVFAIMRVTWYGYGPLLLKGTWVQTVVMIFAVITIIFGSGAAIKERHLKRRLAYSTVSNLSYIVFGVTLMTQAGLAAALTHMFFHGIMKISLFFGAGAVIVRTGKEFIYDMKGFGRRMPVTFGCFTVSALAVIGIPGFCGFVSKWALCTAALESGEVTAMAGIVALIISAIFTSIYLFTVIIPAFFPDASFDGAALSQVKDPGARMLVPMVLLSAASVVLGLACSPLLSFFRRVAEGLI